MEITAEWIDLKVRQYADGEYEAYEALTSKRRVGSWAVVREWIADLLDEVSEDMEAQG